MNESFKDPVCAMSVPPGHGLAVTHRDQVYHFCSVFCRDAFLLAPDTHVAEATALAADEAGDGGRVAYFSMEIAVDPRMNTYSGGLGVLAGDTLRSCADLRVPIVGVTLLSRKGYFRQALDEEGRQSEAPDVWDLPATVEPLPATVEVDVEGRSVRVRAWRHNLIGATGYVVPVVLLDTDVEANAAEDRSLTAHLYGGDGRYRLAQEIVLGMGGVRILRALGYSRIRKFHMNEGHAGLLVLELLRERHAEGGEWDFAGVRSRCVFTTHTPVPAGHDRFGYDLVRSVLGAPVPDEVLRMLGEEDQLNMTFLALNSSRFVNGVARRHGEVSREMFPGRTIHAITNGVHSASWTCDHIATLYDEHLPGWRNDPAMLRQAARIPGTALWEAHAAAKRRLLEAVKERTGRVLDPAAFTIGFARRATAYKRPDLVLTDPERLARLAQPSRPLQLVFAGKAHPRDEGGKELIRRIVAAARDLTPRLPIVYLPDYGLELAKLLVSGVDLWLNTPQPPLEASGTSGMKAAHNGVPSLSTLDGWWPEGRVEGLTGWSVAPGDTDGQPNGPVSSDAEALYHKLEDEVLPLYFGDREGWANVMRHVIALNASHFNTHRMVQQYVTNAYLA